MSDNHSDLSAIAVEEFYPYPVATVWQAVASPESFGEWMLEQKGFEAVAGTLFTAKSYPLIGTSFTGHLAGEVVEVVEGELLSIRWWDSKSPSLLVWTVSLTLHAEAEGTHVVLRNGGYDLDDEEHRRARTIAELGWPTVMSRLGQMCARLSAEQLRNDDEFGVTR